MKKTEYKPFLESKRIYFVPLDDDIDDNYLIWVNDRKVVEYLETGNFPGKPDLLHTLFGFAPDQLQRSSPSNCGHYR